MSMRPRKPATAVCVRESHSIEDICNNIDTMKKQIRDTDATIAATQSPLMQDAAYHALSPTEQSVANLGINPTHWKPIAYLNNRHYEQLLKANMLDEVLARRIEAYRVLSKEESGVA